MAPVLGTKIVLDITVSTYQIKEDIANNSKHIGGSDYHAQYWGF